MHTPWYEKHQEIMPTHFSPRQPKAQPGTEVNHEGTVASGTTLLPKEGLGNFKDMANKALKSFHK